MKFPLSWVQEFLPLTLTPTQVEITLNQLGIEVEKITQEKLLFSHIVVAKVIATEPHPNADRLKIATVTNGKEEYKVVCGAPNCREGVVVAFAPIGSYVVDKDGMPSKIKKSKIRGVESEGMLCSAEELALSTEKTEGILELSSTLHLGTDFASCIGDPIFEIGLTPNLGHCLSIIGIARELAAAYSTKIQPHPYKIENQGNKTLPIEINTKLCSRYACRIVTEIDSNGETPPWIKKKLLAAGINSISNIVDIANYVTLETGQPLHIFDLDTISSKIVVSTTQEKTPLQTLDTIVRQLPEGAITISDAKKILAIAGIMGSLDSAVTKNTKNILIEGAAFDPNTIRKISRQIELPSDAAYRFARGIDKGAVSIAIDKAASLIQQIAGGTIHPLVDHISEPFQKTVQLRISYLKRILGFALSTNEVVSLLNRLEMEVEVVEENILLVTIPSYRNDINIEADLTQEVARLYGYDNIPKTLSPHIDSTLPNTPLYEIEKNIRQYLVEQGLQECITSDLISPTLSHNTMEKDLPQSSCISVLHPQSIEQSVLRTSLLPGLLQIALHNFHHKVENVAAFEIGRVHFRTETAIEEPSCAAIILTGSRNPHHFDHKETPFDFFDIKGIMETLCHKLRIKNFSFTASNLMTLHPFRQAKIESDKITIGVCGEVNPQLLKKFDIHKKVYFAEINLPDILQLKKKPILYKEPSPFPASERDATITISTEITLETIKNKILQNKPPHLENFYLLDLYTNQQLGNEVKNITFRFIYRSTTTTLSSNTIDQEHNMLISFLNF